MMPTTIWHSSQRAAHVLACILSLRKSRWLTIKYARARVSVCVRVAYVGRRRSAVIQFVCRRALFSIVRHRFICCVTIWRYARALCTVRSRMCQQNWNWTAQICLDLKIQLNARLTHSLAEGVRSERADRTTRARLAWLAAPFTAM